jgi:hypothetical protein
MSKQYVIYAFFGTDLYYTDQTIEEINHLYKPSERQECISCVSVVTSDVPPKRLVDGKLVDMLYSKIEKAA